MNLDAFRTLFFEGAPRYQWLETLGRGGMGIVYKARDLELDEVVAIKVLYANITEDEGATVARFKREINLNRRIKHGNVARMYEFGTSHGHPYITMEFVPGRELEKIIVDEGRISPARALPILRQIVAGTGAAHEQGIVHRDLKSQNIIVGDKGNVSILDFGLAKGGVNVKLTLDAVVLGTPHYISPEQALGREADARSDIYSIGIIAFESLTGVLPFTADTVLGIAMKHVNEPVPNNLNLYRDIPQPLRAAVVKALAKKPEERFQTATELEAELGRVEELLKAAPAISQVSVAPVPVQPGGSAATQVRAQIDTVTPVVPHRIRRPMTQPPPPPAPRPAPPQLAPPEPLDDPTRKPVVLLADNDGGVRIPNAAALDQSGCQTVEAKNGQEALELLMKTTPDLIILDAVIPGLDGFEVTRIVRSQPTFARVPVVLLSAKYDKTQTSFANQVGATEILPRPITASQLVFRVWRLLTARGFVRLEKTGGIQRPATDPGAAGRGPR